MHLSADVGVPMDKAVNDAHQSELANAAFVALVPHYRPTTLPSQPGFQLSIAEGPKVRLTLRWRGQSRANSSRKCPELPKTQILGGFWMIPAA